MNDMVQPGSKYAVVVRYDELPGARERAKAKAQQMLASEAERLGYGHLEVPVEDTGTEWRGSFQIRTSPRQVEGFPPPARLLPKHVGGFGVTIA